LAVAELFKELEYRDQGQSPGRRAGWPPVG
jgi:hypothetical protein